MTEFHAVKIWSYLVPFFGALFATLLLVPFVKRINTRLGMVDMPSERRINKVPVARGGGVAIVIGVIGTYAAFTSIAGVHPIPGVEGFGGTKFWQLMLIAAAVAMLGYLDDKFSLPPRVKLAGQLVAASLVWWWIGLGFSRLFPSLPSWLDFVITVFWITGAVNAFNLIDGLDGLASGLALIATLGMTGSLFLLDKSQSTMFYFAFAGSLLGFLRYNYNPASIFLGDSGSMFIGFILATMPLVLQSPDSLLVSVGMPLLAMGVPIFDTAVAILRRYLRRILEKRSGLAVDGKGHVMTADTDHTHHRILRAAGLNQRKAALVLYAVAVFFVAVGLVGMSLKSRAAGLWLFAVAAASIVVFKDIARVELFDAGKILRDMAFTRDIASRRRFARLSIPFHVAFDIFSFVAAYFACQWIFDMPIAKQSLRVELPIRAFALFVCLVFFRTYRTSWARAMLSNYARLLVACLFGSALGAIAIYYSPVARTVSLKSTTPVYAMTVFVLLLLVRVARPVVRDLFYAIDCNRMYSRPGVSRILVYGSGLRYRAFRRELVRGASSNDRMIVGLIDDDILLRGQYIGGIRVLGTLFKAPEIIRKHRIDTVVIACEFPNKWMRVVRKMLEPTGVAISKFTLAEELVCPGKPKKAHGASLAILAAALSLFATGCVSGGGEMSDFRDVVSSAKESVFPSLVYVRVITDGVSDGKIQKVEASGSGVIVTGDGELLTNHHVIDKASRIRCQMSDGRMYDAKVVGKDKDLDIALLKLCADEGEKFPHADLSTRWLEVGEVVLAMGAPWGLARSVSMGIVSCNDRYLENCGDYTLWYQTDAAISPGNSGGPLVDTEGKVVGINARSNLHGGQSFTIPSTIILEVLPNLRKHGNAHWTWFGVDWQPLKDFDRDTFFSATNGVVVSSVDPQGPAKKAGMEANDRVVAINGAPVTATFREQIPALNRRLALSDPGAETVFEFIRNGETKKVSVVPQPKGGVEGAEREFKRWGFVAKEINRFDTPDLAFFAPTGGVFVSSVSWDGNADNAGLKKRDIIKKWGGVEIATLDALGAEYDKAISNLAVRTQAGVEVLRKGHSLRFVINYRNDPDKDEADKD